MIISYLSLLSVGFGLMNPVPSRFRIICRSGRQGEREKKTERAEPDGKKILKKVEGVVITNVKISEKGPSHDIIT